MLIVESIVVHRGRRQVLGPLSLSLGPGEMVAVCGPNGAGKTTLIKALSGELVPSAGSVRLDGHEISRLSAAELAVVRAVVPQSTVLDFPFTVEEVVQLGAAVPGFGAHAVDGAVEAMAKVGLAGMGHRLYVELSGGERQRVHFARALCQLRAGESSSGGAARSRCRFLLLDEPTANLDFSYQSALLSLAREEGKRGTVVVAVLHDLNLAARWADRLVLVADGRMAADGTPRTVIDDAILSRAYGCTIRANRVPEGGGAFVLPQLFG